MARAAAFARQAALVKKAESDSARLGAADRAYQDGDVSVAGRIYMSLVRRRGPMALTARERLERLAGEAQVRLKEIERELAGRQAAFSPGDFLDPSGPPDQWTKSVTAAFGQYDRLADDYDWYRPVGRGIKRKVSKERRKPEFAVVLNEPEAKALWETGQEHEADGHACCAYWVYRRAARLTPAPSARLAANRLAAMEADPQIVEAAKACRELQECHKLYNRAQLFAETKPARAKEILEEILTRAPADSEVCRAAREHLQSME
jgi:hypothetical protein